LEQTPLSFPSNFIFGTSTSAYQIETAFEHDWQGVKAADGYVFDKTTDHEHRLDEDCDIIAQLAPNYRMSLMWSKLQREPMGRLHEETRLHYHQLLQKLRDRNVNIMMVLYHWGNPTWFAQRGGWTKKENASLWLDFARKVVDEYGHYVSYWNTFNEPNLYLTMSLGIGEFPPFKRNLFHVLRAVNHVSLAHDDMYRYIKSKFPDSPVGISHNCSIFSGENWLGKIPASLADYWYMKFLPSKFHQADFVGLSYYARIRFDPFPKTQLYTPDKMKSIAHDDIWELYPEGLGENIERYWKIYKKPIIITENGVCTKDDALRVNMLRAYLEQIRQQLNAGVDVRGYFHWSTWDNFEWTLGPTYQFGLYACDPDTYARSPKASGQLYSTLAYNKTWPGNDHTTQ